MSWTKQTKLSDSWTKQSDFSDSWFIQNGYDEPIVYDNYNTYDGTFSTVWTKVPDAT